MKQFILKKKDLNAFIGKLSEKMKVVAPVAKGAGNFAFDEILSADEIVLDYIPTILPPKKYFMPQREKVLEFDISGDMPKDTVVTDAEPVAIFGVHTCDLAGIQCLNGVFSEEPEDANYMARKNKIFLIGLECNKYCDEHATCALMGTHLPNGGYDLMFTDLGEEFLVDAGTDNGEEFVKGLVFMPEASSENTVELDKLREEKKTIFKNEIGTDLKELPGVFDKGAESKVWGDLGEKCLSCGNCTNVCPTCYCFDMSDTINLDMKTGVRTRTWDSCQFETFALVAGGENFRAERADRQKHRYYRKFKFPYDKYDRFFCTGCGRCTRTCMAGISLKETLKTLIEENI